MDRQDYVIEVSHVSKSFKDNKVLKDVSLLCESGKIYGLVGHNGSGKTVLFKSICGFLSCDEGTITVNGKVMGKDKDMLTDAGLDYRYALIVNDSKYIEIPTTQKIPNRQWNKITADYNNIISEFTVYLSGFKRALKKNRINREALYRESSLINFTSELTS